MRGRSEKSRVTESNDGNDWHDDERVPSEQNATNTQQDNAEPEMQADDEFNMVENEPHASEGDALVENAVREIQRIGGELSLAEEERQERLSVFLARVYMASMSGKQDVERHKALLKKSGVSVQKNTPHQEQTLRAILSLASVKLVKQTEHECFLVLDGLDLSDVPASEQAVGAYLAETVEIRGKHVTGFSRAKAERASSIRLKEQRDERRMEQIAEKDEILRAAVSKGEQNIIGNIDVSDEGTELNSDIWVSVNRGHRVLMSLNLRHDQIRSIVLRSNS